MEGVDVERNDCSEAHVCSDSELDRALEHLAKEKNVLSDSDIHQKPNFKDKGMKIRGSSKL